MALSVLLIFQTLPLLKNWPFGGYTTRVDGSYFGGAGAIKDQ